MATQLQLRRGTTTETDAYTGAVGEVIVNTTKDTLVVQDGATQGGHELAKADGTNITGVDSLENGGNTKVLATATGIDVTGNLTIASGNGVYLGGTGAANKLDDYEEGTWTPALGGTWTTNPTSPSGTYTKVGRVVTITMSFSGGVKSSAVAGYFTGLPVAMLNNGTGVVNDTGIVAQGTCSFANTDRVWVTENTLGSSNYLTGQYITA